MSNPPQSSQTQSVADFRDQFQPTCFTQQPPLPPPFHSKAFPPSALRLLVHWKAITGAMHGICPRKKIVASPWALAGGFV
ncbi:hypothetical protein PCANC_23688 [Puccinia coronata f. sp. avenae]|uniref:Uncharacterized protein n=1 Tax=Puccinia coronata f. sp. avenae TaxID=200324 RepID=A0A2N5UAK6_9BASI|nr:hypothetical protein PCANC_23688 [Puccinia coronata f. sp. avenae]